MRTSPTGGVFWRNVPEGRDALLETDFRTSTDCRALTYDDGEIDCAAPDPPRMHSPGGSARKVHTTFYRRYRNNGIGIETAKKYREAALSLYEDAGIEAYRVLRYRGALVKRRQDEFWSNRRRFPRVEILRACEQLGFIAKNLFFVVRWHRPGVSRAVRQARARMNHSQCLIFWK
ncbi:MAG: hypothetical protein OXI01_24485 [Albidovulum sp.]|nr:hypothetical protein [Albidovulum sp.]